MSYRIWSINSDVSESGKRHLAIFAINDYKLMMKIVIFMCKYIAIYHLVQHKPVLDNKFLASACL